MNKKMLAKAIPFDDIVAEWMKNPEFRKEYEALQPGYQLARQMIGARLKQKMTQASLAKRAGTGQAVISRLEGMNAKPSFSLVQRIANALGTDFTIKIIAT
jgi:DNA-binding XRE family transcriptional regulator